MPSYKDKALVESVLDTYTNRMEAHKRTDAAASSGVAPRPRGILPVGPLLAPAFPPGIPSATFLPSISMLAPASFAAVNLETNVSVE